ncbi:MAG: 3'-5' exonuclease, partial [Plesiomonas shigelloides]
MTSRAAVVAGRVLSRTTLLRGSECLVEYIIKTQTGALRVEVPAQKPMAFCHTQDVPRLTAGIPQSELAVKSLSLESFARQAVSALYVNHPHTLRRLLAQAEALAIPLFEADIKAEQRFLIERFIALDAEFQGCFRDNTSFIARQARATNLALPLKAVSLDVECSMQGELYSIGLYGEVESVVLMVGRAGDIVQSAVETVGAVSLPHDNRNALREAKPATNAAAPQAAVNIHWVADELSLLLALNEWFHTEDPDLILGWSVVTFDLSLLWRRARLYGIRLNLGRFGRPLGWKVTDKHRPETLDLPGRVVLDGIDWLKAAFYQFDSFALDKVAQQLLGEGKAIDNPSNRGDEITRLFQQDKAALAFYNLTDCRLVWDIFAKTDLIN